MYAGELLYWRNVNGFKVLAGIIGLRFTIYSGIYFFFW
jgi:hypothetical protein